MRDSNHTDKQIIQMSKRQKGLKTLSQPRLSKDKSLYKTVEHF